MKAKATLDEILSPLLQRFQKDNFVRQDVNEKPPLRSELFSTEQMEQLAQHLAATHTVSTEQAPELLLKRLAENESILFHVTSLLHDSVREKKAITPAGEWLLDNFYLIEDQIRIGKRYLPKGYSKGLPRLSNGPAAGFPRVYDIAIQIISHSDGRVDINSLSSFIAAYQKVNFLTLGELWAIPILLRLALLENLSRVAARIAVDRVDADLATEWGDRVIQTAEENPKDLVITIADMARSNPPMVSAFVAEFTRKLQWKGLDLTLPLTWLEQHLSEIATTINLMVLQENQKQAADQLSMSNSINSLRFLAKMDWREFVETMSIVEQTLLSDVDGVYPKMDFYTRDNYRHAVEKIAKRSTLSEYEVARTAIDLARSSAASNPSDTRKAHVGYYLVGRGVTQTEKASKMKLNSFQALERFLSKSARVLYFSVALLIVAVVSYAFISKAYDDGLRDTLLIVIGVLATLGASHLALALINWWATVLAAPKPLPRMDFSTGIPPENRTLVVVPTIIANVKQAAGLVEDLEVRFLANRDKNLIFGLLTDFKDAPQEVMPDDAALIDFVEKSINALNVKYAAKNPDAFCLFHRPRVWNARDKVWMGYERKRGKLGDLNQLLKGEGKDRFSHIVGHERFFTNVKFVITLDTDTQLPRDAAWKLVGLMAHPLNQARYSEKLKRVVEGYGIIQPRIAVSLHGAVRSRYTRMHETDSGIDPYTRVTSDLYQDVFEEGSFIGKGIYDVDAFEKAVGARFPENRILSHDLLEGSYARCGFASDVQFYEEYPSRYSMDAARRHRWTRGDWQIANWFLPFVPGAKKRFTKNSISALSRWKIFDNLRRSIIPIAFMAILVLGWTLMPDPWFWTLITIGMVMLPSLLQSTWSGLRKPPEITYGQHLNNSFLATYKNMLQALFTLVCLPFEAFMSLDAIVRTLWRIYISRRKLLEWNPSGFVQKKTESPGDAYMMMWVSTLSSFLIFAYLWQYKPEALWIAFPFVLVWAVSPSLVWWLSRPLPPQRSSINEDEKLYLRELARKTWAFFESLVTKEDHWLPPDNLQQYPIPVVAHRTSPTNIGLSLLANLTAVDFGYSTVSTLLERTTNTFGTLAVMDRYLGHFYNWYDTQTLHTLNPRYISTVDSGNFAGHLLTLRQGLLALPSSKIISVHVWDGLHDTLRLAAIQNNNKHAGLAALCDEFNNGNPIANVDVVTAATRWETFASRFQNVHDELRDQTDSELQFWLSACAEQLKRVAQEFAMLTPWIVLTAPTERCAAVLPKEIPTLLQVASWPKIHKEHFEALRMGTDLEQRWIESIEKHCATASEHARARMAVIQDLANQAEQFADMEYGFLYDKSQRLLAIGFNVDENHRDASFYDLLASEARLGVFVAIAQGKLPQESWFALGRRLTTADNTPVLLSWSGSMFEYLMPVLVMPTYENTLLDETCKGTVKKQIEYGRQQRVPWGISESCYNIVDASLTYQYRAFGVPGLGFKRGLGLDLVIAPYATVMALMIDPKASYSNLRRLQEEGFEGKFGFFESIDYTPARLPRGQSRVVIQTFMAHHQGMGLLSLAYLLLDQPMQKRFEADAQFQTALLLLQEQVPKAIGYYSASTEMEDITPIALHSQIRVIHTPHTPTPEVQLLSNGRYHVMMTNAGGGYSRWKEMAVTRWREDTTTDTWGAFCYIRDLNSDVFWSNTHQPTAKEADQYTAVFSQGRVEYRRRDENIETYTEVIVSPEDDIEIRRIHITNRSKEYRRLEFTSYAEVVLAIPVADAAHPTFSNLFVQTEILSQQQALLCTRRPRSKDERPPFMFHLMKVNTPQAHTISYETDRLKFIGRGHTVRHPHVMDSDSPLSGSQGSVLDPIVAIQYRLSLQPDEIVTIDIITGIADTREASQNLIDRYQDLHLRDRAFELSWTHSQVVLRQINATEAEAELYGRLASSVIYTNPALRAASGVLLKNQRGQSALWSYSISGDLPIVLLHVSDSANITLVKQLIQAQAYWHLKGLAADLVILNEDPSGYRQLLQDQIQGLIAAGIGTNTSDKQGRIFVRPVDQVSTEDRILLQAVARVIISDSRGTLEDQMNKRTTSKQVIPYLTPTTLPAPVTKAKMPVNNTLQFFNGRGGFSADGKEYVIHSGVNQTTPLPWINVIANPNFGTIITENGPSYTWSENAHGFRLTPWHNDPVSDASGEAYYLRDEENGEFWSPMPGPAPGIDGYTTRHGFGYSSFDYAHDGIASEACTFVAKEASVKFMVIKIRNNSAKARKLSVTGYAEWVLGNLRSKSAMHIVSELETRTGTLLIKNSYNTEFPNRMAFFDVDEAHYTFTTDRTEFVGRNGSLKNPDGMRRAKLSGRYGAGTDPCTALQVPFELEPGATREVIFTMGAGRDRHEVELLIRQFRDNDGAAAELKKVKAFWNHTLGTIQIETPDTSLNILTNGWLQYQVMSCRLWGRSGFYQSGGAFGFRDQLQDTLALLHAEPELTREQILLAASRQFQEGDAQHWWHPPVGRGVRTLCSDDFLWLPYVTSRYVATTGDASVLTETTTFLEGRPLNAQEESYYDLPLVSERRGSIYEHGKRAIQRALHYGKHGLPFIGSGDWNDGMNMVGIHGKGESVWLAFFLYDVLNRFIPLAESQSDLAFVDVCKQNASLLKQNINKNAWDGQWYRRAYFDDGTPLGSSDNDECRIDSIAQSWSILSGAGDPERVQLAMKSVDQFLINKDKKLIQLLEPPFDKSEMDPGYIKGYVPGVRENGGQYTHAAIWMVMAFAKLGDRHHTWELLNMINPIQHGKSEADVAVYKVEPYVMAADVYGVYPHTGRGGWTWYTGSAGWMYQLILESFLGLKREGDKLSVLPCVPDSWPSFNLRYRYLETDYHITVQHDPFENTAEVDGVMQPSNVVLLKDDKVRHEVILKWTRVVSRTPETLELKQ
ncbi:GH36-type glycosyl hydrolase domain-containing protein [Chryseolinea lacunae]|uniref:Cyclic beta 1-2 glucan synthetase n=1 Tax=Chryseolinea lacunae TaxID=2801331 RepID=A0ABS1KZU8_9BACT|nr:glucoamylase family protein [Chryseolinea lacunae]MBL0744875.1 cyclic beta 1-2 glucan synthetase [Chryseolinea lacunae]